MIFNIIIGLLVPWATGIILYYKDKKTLILITPFVSTISFTINAVCFHRDLWNLYPFESQHIADIPFDLGLYPILGAWMIYSIKRIKLNPYIIIVIYTIFTTFLEFLGLLSGRAFYANGWNIFLTVFSYFVPYILSYYYYQYLKKLEILN